MDGDAIEEKQHEITRKSVSIDEKNIDASERAAVENWNKKISAAKVRFKPDFDRMRLNCAFLAGYQWPGQRTIEWRKVVVNVILQMVKDICSNLYAKNPKISVDRRRTMDFELWDESLRSLQEAAIVASSPLMALDEQQLLAQLQAKAQAQALLQDIQIGQQWRKQVDRVAKTLLTCDEWMIANCQPSYKQQLKQAVMRALICGVAYEATDFTRAYEGAISQGEIESTMEDRTKRAQFLAEKLSKGDLKKDSGEVQEMIALVNSLGQSAKSGDGNNVHERIRWSYPLAWTIIPDTNCANLSNFIGADWICEEQCLPLDQVNAYFETQIKTSGTESGAKEYPTDGQENSSPPTMEDPKREKRVMLRHVWQLSTKSHFYIVDGWKEWVMEQEPVEPESNYFWPVRSLVFNNIEPVNDGEHKVSIFPPSHVDVLRDIQKEINRCRQSLRKHRQGNIPKWVFNSGLIDAKDIERLANADDQEFVPVKSLPPNTRLEDALHSFDGSKFKPELVDVGPQIQDMSLVATSGSPATSPGANHRQTATAAHIQEQTRTSILSSDVDTLDEFLSTGAEQRGEYMLRELSPETAKRIAGRGAVWPSDPKMRQEFIQALTLNIKAASSGRPNQALKIATAERIGPLLKEAMMQQGLSLEPLVEEYAHALDETLDVEKFFKPAPTPPTAPPPQGAQPGKPQQPPQPGAQAKPAQKQILTNGATALPLRK